MGNPESSCDFDRRLNYDINLIYTRAGSHLRYWVTKLPRLSSLSGTGSQPSICVHLGHTSTHTSTHILIRSLIRVLIYHTIPLTSPHTSAHILYDIVFEALYPGEFPIWFLIWCFLSPVIAHTKLWPFIFLKISKSTNHYTIKYTILVYQYDWSYTISVLIRLIIYHTCAHTSHQIRNTIMVTQNQRKKSNLSQFW